MSATTWRGSPWRRVRTVPSIVSKARLWHMPQSPSMSGGWKRTPSGVGTWQSAHSSCWPKPWSAPSRRAIWATPPARSRCRACGNLRLLISRGRWFERDALHPRLLAVPADQHRRLEFGMEPLEIGGVAEPGVGQPRVEIGVAVGAEMLRRRRDLLRPLMLGMAVDAAARRRGRTSRWTASWTRPPGAEVGLRPRQPGVDRHGRGCWCGRRCRTGRAPRSNGWTWQAVQLLASAAWPVDRLPLSHSRSAWKAWRIVGAGRAPAT